MIFRLAKLDDCKEISKLKRRVWETTYRGIYSDEKINNYDYQKNEEYFKAIINNPKLNLYIVEIAGKIIAYMECGTPMRPFSSYAQEIGLLYIDKEYQGQGIGKKLFEIGYNDIKEKGYKEFFISCNKYNKNAQGFYEKMGGKIVQIDEDQEDKSIPQIKYHYDII